MCVFWGGVTNTRQLFFFCMSYADILSLIWLHPDADGNQAFAVHWEPPPEYTYKWKHKHPEVPKSLRIYECHVGISGLEPKIASFNDFTEKVTQMFVVNILVSSMLWYDLTFLVLFPL